MRKGKFPKAVRSYQYKSKPAVAERVEAPLGSGPDCSTETRKLMRMMSENNR